MLRTPAAQRATRKHLGKKKGLKFFFKKKNAGAAYACGAQGHAQASESSGCRSKIVSGGEARRHAYVAGTRTLLVLY